MEMLETIFGINTFAAAVRVSTPIVLASLGGMLSERAGIINIALEGKILIGAFFGVLGSYYTGNPYFGVLIGTLAGAFWGLMLAVLTVRFKADHVVAGVGLNILAAGLTGWLLQVVWKVKGTSDSVVGIGKFAIPVLEKIPVLGKVLFNHSPIVYMMFIIVIVAWIVMYKMPIGVRIRVIGEHPAAADTLGINVIKIKYACVIISGALAGLGGTYLSLGYLNWFSMNMSAGRGYMALAANVFGRWHPIGNFFASFLFAFTDSMQMRLQGVNSGIANEIIQSIPYIITIIVLASAVKGARQPEALGKHYEIGGK